MKDRKFVNSILIAGFFLSSCRANDIVKVTATEMQTNTPTPTHTFTPSPTETPTRTPTNTPTRTPTSTRTPDWAATNEVLIENARKEEELTLVNPRINNVSIITLPLVGELVYGAQTDENGQTTHLIENFDCEFKEIRENGELGEKVEDSATLDKWETDVVFDEINVKKSSDIILGVEVMTSESFIKDGEEHSCQEYSQKQKLYDRVRPLLQNLQSFIEGLSQQK